MSRKTSSSAPSSEYRRGQLDRVADVAQLLEAHALDDAAAGDVEAGDHALLDHRSDVREQARARRAAALGMELDAGERAALDGGDDRAVVVDPGGDDVLSVGSTA